MGVSPPSAAGSKRADSENKTVKKFDVPTHTSLGGEGGSPLEGWPIPLNLFRFVFK
jgi:hypothetical protein